ncbi:MAG: GNAT family N-acetyltransferase [Oscillospiraceae bacterium]|jgi:ribosomal-protein-alanine N-acetyltransferase|nr:GNAT family N-acetyltransferase [Oscillospiraceae bacterium]
MTFQDKTGATITLRPFNNGDIDALTEYANNSKIANNLRDGFPNPYTREAGVAFLEDANKNPEKQRIFAIDLNGEAVGSIGFFLKDGYKRKSAEIGYWLGEPFWRRGIASKSLLLLTRLAFETFDILRLYAEPYAQNIGSRRLLEKCGYTYEGTLRSSVYKNGLIFDSCVYSILKDEVEALQ